MSYIFPAGGGLNGELFRASGLTFDASSDTVTAETVNDMTGSAGAIDTTRISSGLLVVTVTGIDGTDPTLAVFFDAADAFGTWVQTSNAISISGAVLTSTGTIFGNITTGYALTNRGRIRWTVGGTDPAFTGVSLSLFGQ